MKHEPLPLPETFPPDSLFGFRNQGEECFNEIEDAVRDYVESREWPTIAQCIEGAEWPLVVDEFKQMAKPTPEKMLERLLEGWHEDFGDPAGDPADPTPEMISAMKTILDGLTVWACEETGRSFTVTKEDAKRLLESEE